MKDALKTAADTVSKAVPEKFTEVLEGVQDKADVLVDEAASTVSDVLETVNQRPVPGLIRYKNSLSNMASKPINIRWLRTSS